MTTHKHENNCIDGHCKHCGIKMIGHQTVEEWQAVVRKNKEWWYYYQEATKSNNVAIGCLLDPNEKDAANSKNRRYV